MRMTSLMTVLAVLALTYAANAQCATSFSTGAHVQTQTFAVPLTPTYSVPTTTFAAPTTGCVCPTNTFSTPTYNVPTTTFAVATPVYAVPTRQFSAGVHYSQNFAFQNRNVRFANANAAQVQQRGLINFNGGLLGLLRGSGQSANQRGLLNFN